MRFCDPALLEQMLACDHAEMHGDMVALTESGLRHYANKVRGLLTSQSQLRLKRIRWLRQYVEFDDMEFEVKPVHIKALQILAAARSTSSHTVQGDDLPTWGLQQLVKSGLVAKHGNGRYSITGDGVMYLQRMDEGVPAEVAPYCDACVYQEIVTALATRMPEVETLEQLIRDKLAAERAIASALDDLKSG